MTGTHRRGRWLLVAALAALAGAYFGLGLDAYLGPEQLAAGRERLVGLVAEHPLAGALVCLALYAAVAALSLPIAAVMSLLIGALFGRWLGLLIVDVGATVGATLAFLSARLLLRDWVQRHFGPRLEVMERGLRMDGLSYLLFLRLIPLFPFFLINLAAGLTTLPIRTFILGTAGGIIPGAFLYVNAGFELGLAARPADLLSARVIAALALLGLLSLLPVGYKAWKRRP
jgi:uncharacterized membrane protein YdjX (TVP38/TMEM64 family)